MLIAELYTLKDLLEAEIEHDRGENLPVEAFERVLAKINTMIERKVAVTVDPDTGAIYVYVSDKQVATSDHYSDVVNADFDADEHLVGVEILP